MSAFFVRRFRPMFTGVERADTGSRLPVSVVYAFFQLSLNAILCGVSCVTVGAAVRVRRKGSKAKGKRKMLSSTKTAVRAVCAADPSVTAEQVAAAIDALEGKVDKSGGMARAYSAREVAELLNVSSPTVRRLARRGLLQPVGFCGGRERVTRYSGASVKALLDGSPVAGNEAAR